MILCRFARVRSQPNQLKDQKHHRQRLFSSYVAALLCGGFLCGQARAQSALSPFELLAAQAFNPSAKTFTSFTMNGTVSWTAGSLHETGNVQLTMGADGSTAEQWTLSTQSHSSEQTAFASGRGCTYTDPAGKPHASADANCWRAVPWFAPWMAINLLPGNLVMGSDISSSADTAGGFAVLQFLTQMNASTSATDPLAQIQRSTAASVYYDLKTGLPSAVDYDYVLDSDPAHVIKYETVFSDYRPESGFVLPHRMQRYVQRTLQADITITSVAVQ